MKIEIAVLDDDQCAQAAVIWRNLMASTMSEIDQIARQCLKHDLNRDQALEQIRDLTVDVLCKLGVR